MSDKIERGHVCEHGIRWPHACQPCDDAGWAKQLAPPKSPPQPAVSVEQADREVAADIAEIFYARIGWPAERCETPGEMRRGERDEDPIVQVIAQRRLSPPADGILQEAIATIIGRCEALEDEASDALAAVTANSRAETHEAGFWRGQKSTAKSIRNHLADLTRAALSAAPPADGVLLSDERDQILHGQLRESILDLRNHLTRNRDRDMAYVIKLLDAVVSDAHTRAAPKAPTAPIGEAARPGREEIAEAVGSLLDDKVHAEARRLHLADATQSGYEHHLIRVAGEMALSALFDGASA